MAVMTALTVTLFLFSYGFRGPGRINRIEGAVLLSGYIGYTAYLVTTVFKQAA
jgi:cation:H+ antiporter